MVERSPSGDRGEMTYEEADEMNRMGDRDYQDHFRKTFITDKKG